MFSTLLISLVFGLWSLVFGLWSLVFGLCFSLPLEQAVIYLVDKEFSVVTV